MSAVRTLIVITVGYTGCESVDRFLFQTCWSELILAESGKNTAENKQSPRGRCLVVQSLEGPLTRVLATYKGTLSDERFLPASGNHIGDMWIANGVPWVWIYAPGASSRCLMIA